LNAFVLTASAVEISAPRNTPAGIPALDLQLEHESEQIEAGQSRKVKLKLRARALGPTAETLSKLSIGKPAKFKGFLASAQNGKGSTLHITHIELN